MSFLEVKNLGVRLKDFSLEGISFSLGRGEYLSVIGPTGSGKTIFIETIVGVFKGCTGRILLDGRDITHALPEDRGVGIVYQDYVLMPHMTVLENMAYGLKNKDRRNTTSKTGAAAGQSSGVEQQICRMAGSLNIAHLLHRLPATLSGGEQQRVALGRALIAKPSLLLLDEPFSALDRQTRTRARNLLKKAVETTGTTVIHITHDLDDAWALASQLAVFKKGRMLCMGPLDQVVSRPVSRFAAGFVGTGVYPATVVSCDGCTTIVDAGWAIFSSGDRAVPGRRVNLFIRSENIEVARCLPAGGLGANAAQVRVGQLIRQGPLCRIALDAGSCTLDALVPSRDVQHLALCSGDLVYAVIRKENICIGEETALAP